MSLVVAWLLYLGIALAATGGLLYAAWRVEQPRDDDEDEL